MKTTESVARIDNQFVYHARYQLTAREAKVVLYLVSKIDPVRQKNLIKQVVSVKDLERILRGDNKKWGGIYKELLGLTRRIIRKSIEFPTDIELEGRSFPGYVNWFQQIVPVRDEKGSVALEFLFSQTLQPFLLNLKEYVSINFLEVAPLKSSFSIRMYQVFRAHRNKMEKHQKRSKLRYELADLKSMLGIEGKYDDYRNFRLKVLEVLKKEITKHTSISLKYIPIKKGRRVVEIEFEFWDSKKREKLTADKSSDLTLGGLTFAQVKAFDRLVAYGVRDDISLGMIAKIKGSEMIGFEDWYFEEVIRIFESKTNQEAEIAKAGTLVNWFLKKRIFEQGDHFAKIIERLQARKKKLQVENPVAWDNRQEAKRMTSKEFTTKYHSGK